MKQRTLGTDGPRVSALGLGCMGMTDFYGPADRAESIATLHAAFERGVTLLDTGDYYGAGTNEMLIGDALRGRNRDPIVISVKFGALRDPGGAWLGIDTRPKSIKNYIGYTLRRLGTNHVDIYRPGRVDPAVPIEETAGAVADLIAAGYVRQLGLSEAGVDTIRRAHAVHPVADLQIEYSLLSRGIEPEILPACRELGIAITAYGVLSRGLLSGYWTRQRSNAAAPGDFRGHAPRFAGENLEHNLQLVEALRGVAGEKGMTVAQAAIAWVLSRGADIVPLVGARRRDQLDEAIGALDLALDATDLERIERAVPAGAAAGERYAPHLLATLDSERGRDGG